jgi:hypothetical protein
MAEESGRSAENESRRDETFKRHGPEPPENDSGPSPSEAEPQTAQSRRDEVRKDTGEDFDREHARK